MKAPQRHARKEGSERWRIALQIGWAGHACSNMFSQDMEIESALTILRIGSSVAYKIGMVIGSVFWILVIVLFFVGLGKFRKTRQGKWLATTIVAGFLLFLTFGNLAISLAQFGLRAKQEQKERESLVDGREVKTLSGRLSLKLPAKWKMWEGLNEYATLEIANTEREEYLIVHEIQKEEFAGDLRLFEKLETDSLVALAEGAPLSDGKESMVGPMKMILREAASDDIYCIQACIEGKERYYKIMAWAEKAHREDSLRTFEGILASAVE